MTEDVSSADTNAPDGQNPVEDAGTKEEKKTEEVISAIKTPAPPPKRQVDRRSFFSWLGLAWMAFGAATLGVFSAIGRLFFPNVLFEPPLSFKAGFTDEYIIDVVDERFKESFGVWLVRTSSEMYALSTVCTHLGCTPNWLSAEGKFKCPCHGSGFYKTGINFEGPAPRPLERYRIAYTEDGQILVDKNRKFQYEKGQWKDPESFIKV